MTLFRKRKPTPAVAPLPASTVPPVATAADRSGTAVSRPGASWLTYPTLSHGNAGMVKLSGPTYYRAEISAVIRRYGALALAELRVETTGQYAGAVRVFVDGRQVASIPHGLQGEYREVVESLNREGLVRQHDFVIFMFGRAFGSGWSGRGAGGLVARLTSAGGAGWCGRGGRG
jgi:hypothetical protein